LAALPLAFKDLPFLRRSATGVSVSVRVQPRARHTALELTAQGALKVAVTAPPEDGRANEAVVALLAQSWRLPKSAFEVVQGATARNKTIGIIGEPLVLAHRIAEWVRGYHG
jgi:uncharacterized protein (TIGR00251 family)